MSEEEEETDLINLILLNDYISVSNVFLELFETKELTLKFLENVINEIDPNRITEKKKRPLAYDEDIEHFEESSTKFLRPEGEKLKIREENNKNNTAENQNNNNQNNQHNNNNNNNNHNSNNNSNNNTTSSNTIVLNNSERNVESSFTDVIRDIYEDDASDENLIITLGVLIPNDMGLSAYIIGKQGANVTEIRRKTKARTQLEQPKLIPPGVIERNIFFMGTVRAVCEAYQHVFSRIVSKADTLPAGCLDDMKMVIPTELSALLIGKAGVSIKKIQSESGARTHVQSEDEMIQSCHYYGRVIIISGTLRQRCHAVYLILKNLLSQRDFPDAWRGGLPPLISSMNPVQANRIPMNIHMNGVAASPQQQYLHPGHPTHLLHHPPPAHSMTLHPQYNTSFIAQPQANYQEMANVTMNGNMANIQQKWNSSQIQANTRNTIPSNTTSYHNPHYAYTSPAYQQIHQGNIITFPTQQPSIVHMQTLPTHAPPPAPPINHQLSQSHANSHTQQQQQQQQQQSQQQQSQHHMHRGRENGRGY